MVTLFSKSSLFKPHFLFDTNKITALLATLFIISMSWTKFLVLPVTGQKIQIPELLFVALAALALITIKSFQAGLRRLHFLDISVVLFGICSFLNAMVHQALAPWLETIGHWYLIGIYAVVRFFLFPKFGTSFFLRAIKLLGLSTGIIAIGSALLFSAFPFFLVEIAEIKYFPGIGNLPRVEGFTMSPNQLADILIFCFLVEIAHSRRGLKAWLPAVIMLTGLALTLSKSILIAGGGILFLMAQGQKTWLRITSGIGIAALILLFIISTQALMVSRHAEDREIILQQTYVTGKALATIHNMEILETTYFRLKKMAWKAFTAHKAFGIGGGTFMAYVEAGKKSGDYPANLPKYEPHSSYFGLLAEYGIIGFLGFLSIIIAIIFRYKTLNNPIDDKNKALLIGIAAYFIVALAAAFAMDIVNFRHLWLALGILGGLRSSTMA